MAGMGRTIRVYCLDDEFRPASLLLFDRSRAGDALLVISDTTLAELASAPAKVRDVIEAEEYIRQAVVSRRMLADAQHIAAYRGGHSAKAGRPRELELPSYRQPGAHPRIQRCQSSCGLSAPGDPVPPGGLER
jgi:hypothetical protein